MTRIHAAAEKGDLAFVQGILRKTPSAVNERDEDGQTPLHWASYRGHLDLVEALIAAGGDPNLRNVIGYSPLMAAAREGRHAVVERLLAAGADINAATDDGLTAVMFGALYSANAELVARLIRAGAPINETPTGSTPLISAACGGNVGVVKALLDLGAQALARNRKGKSARDFAEERGFNEVSILLEAAEARQRANLS